MDDYDKACGNAEIEVHVTDEHFENLCALLQLDLRTSRIGGLCLKSDYTALGLLPSDRIVPQLALGFDIMNFKRL